MKHTGYILVVVLMLSIGQPSSAQNGQSRNYRIFYANNAALPEAGERDSLLRFIAGLNTRLIESIEITGYCDEIGSNGYNDTLSRKRAQAVADQMLKSGIPATSIHVVVGRGELPAAERPSEKAHRRAFNRRVEVLVQLKNPPKPEASGISPATNAKARLNDHMKVGDKVVLENILFVGGHSDLLAESFPALDSLIAFMSRNKNYHIMIYGHICCEPYGKEGVDGATGLRNLSLARAQKIYQYLVDAHVQPKRMAYKGMRSDYPTGRGAKYDRRVEIEITKID